MRSPRTKVEQRSRVIRDHRPGGQALVKGRSGLADFRSQWRSIASVRMETLARPALTSPAPAAGASDWDLRLAEVASPGPAPLLQSWAWGDFQATTGWRAERVLLRSGMASVLTRGPAWLRRGYVPRGPVPATPEVIEELSEWAVAHGLVRMRIEPEAETALEGNLRSLGFLPTGALHPAHTTIVPLGPPASMLAGFKPKHRYNVNLALNRGVEVEVGADAVEMRRQVGWVTSRSGLPMPRVEYFRNLLSHLPDSRTFVARVGRVPVAGCLIARFDRRCYYLWAGSTGQERQLMPAYAVMWQAMLAMEAAGCSELDLWGLAPPGLPDHPWASLRQFKTGFGGYETSYVGAWEQEFAPLRNRLLREGRRQRRRVGKVIRSLRP